MLNPINKTIELADGRTITIETGKLAKQADGAVTVRMGNTVLLATVCAAKDANPGVDFMPLQVEYKEKFSAFGRFPGGFTKREGKASDYEILTSRLVDRALRPLFPDNYHAEVYVNVILFSADGEDMPDALAGLAASAALAVSDIPFNGPISECRVARIDGKYVVNPTFSELEKADIDTYDYKNHIINISNQNVGLTTYLPSIRATRHSEIGPLKGISDTANAAEAANPASASGMSSPSAENNITFTYTSAW